MSKKAKMDKPKSISINTPREWWNKLDNTYHFTLDVAANCDNALCGEYFTQEQDGLQQRWTGRVWCSPPWTDDLFLWINKAKNSYDAGECELVVMLLPIRDWEPWFDFALRTGTRFVPVQIPFSIPKGYEVEDHFLLVIGPPYEELAKKGFETCR